MSSCDIIVLVAGDEEGLLLGPPEQRAEPPLRAQEQADRVGDPRPQPGVVGLEHDPLSSLVNRPFKEDEQAPDADIFPERVRGERARAPDPDAAPRETCG